MARATVEADELHRMPALLRPNVVELIAASSELYEEVGRVAQALIDVKLRRCAESIDIT
jgi:hypothetical protein